MKFTLEIFKINIIALATLVSLISPAHADFSQAELWVGAKSQFIGPNCWNYALFSAGIISSLRNTEEKEFSFFMNSPLCEKVSTNDAIEPGDIGVIRDIAKGLQPSENHAFIYLTKNLVLTKNGPSVEAPYQKTALQTVLSVPLYKPFKSVTKQRTLFRYRCSSLIDFIAAHPSLNSRLLNIYSELLSFEASYLNTTFFNADLDSEKLALFKNRVSLQIERLKLENLGREDYFFKKSIVFLINGLAGQIYYSHASTPMATVESLASALDSIP